MLKRATRSASLAAECISIYIEISCWLLMQAFIYVDCPARVVVMSVNIMEDYFLDILASGFQIKLKHAFGWFNECVSWFMVDLSKLQDL